MKVRFLLELIQDAQDIINYFDGVESSEQMVSALERLKKREPEEFLACIQTLRLSTGQILDDAFEISGFEPEGLGDDDDDGDDGVDGEDEGDGDDGLDLGDEDLGLDELPEDGKPAEAKTPETEKAK